MMAYGGGQVCTYVLGVSFKGAESSAEAVGSADDGLWWWTGM